MQQQDGTRRIIFMPSSATFRENHPGDRQQYEIQKLNDVTSDFEGTLSWLMANSSTKSS